MKKQEIATTLQEVRETLDKLKTWPMPGKSNLDKKQRALQIAVDHFQKLADIEKNHKQEKLF